MLCTARSSAPNRIKLFLEKGKVDPDAADVDGVTPRIMADTLYTICLTHAHSPEAATHFAARYGWDSDMIRDELPFLKEMGDLFRSHDKTKGAERN